MSWYGVSSGHIQRLIQKLRQEQLPAPLTLASLQAIGLESCWRACQSWAHFPHGDLILVLESLLAERTHAVVENPRLVWTGPSSTTLTHRDTAIVVQDLFTQARQSVWIAGFRFDDGASLFAPLYEGMLQYKMEVKILLDVPRVRLNYSRETHVREFGQSFLRENWPFGKPFPHLYHDPRTSIVDSTVSLHAKCIVVDLSWTLIGSANFTQRGQYRNIELGVLLNHPGFAEEVVAQWQGLISKSHIQGIVPF